MNNSYYDACFGAHSPEDEEQRGSPYAALYACAYSNIEMEKSKRKKKVDAPVNENTFLLATDLFWETNKAFIPPHSKSSWR